MLVQQEKNEQARLLPKETNKPAVYLIVHPLWNLQNRTRLQHNLIQLVIIHKVCQCNVKEIQNTL